MKDRKVTIFENCTQKEGKDVTFVDFVRIGISRKNEIERIRAEADEGKRKQLKQALPCATLSGLFAGGRRAENLVKHSGLICIDIDHCDTTATMNKLKGWDIVAFASRSASGNGVYAIIPLAHPDKHLGQFLALERCFESEGIEIDKACKDVTRIRFISFDDDMFYRPDAAEFTEVYEPTRCTRDSTTHNKVQTFSRSWGNGIAGDDTLKRVISCVEELEARRIDICPDNEAWHKIAASLSTLGIAGEDLFNRVAQLCSDPQRRATTAENSKEFNRCMKENRAITIATFFDECQRQGVIWKR